MAEPFYLALTDPSRVLHIHTILHVHSNLGLHHRFTDAGLGRCRRTRQNGSTDRCKVLIRVWKVTTFWIVLSNKKF